MRSSQRRITKLKRSIISCCVHFVYRRNVIVIGDSDVFWIFPRGWGEDRFTSYSSKKVKIDKIRIKHVCLSTRFSEFKTFIKDKIKIEKYLGKKEAEPESRPTVQTARVEDDRCRQMFRCFLKTLAFVSLQCTRYKKIITR